MPFNGRMDYLTRLSRDLRRNMTEAERALWRQIRGRQVMGMKFRRQVIMGNYIVDFFCLNASLIIEVDGGQHWAEDSNDAVRDAWLRGRGHEVLRFSNADVSGRMDVVLAVIVGYLVEKGDV